MKKINALVVAGLACLFLSGCVVGRRTVSLTVPTAASMGSGSKGTVVVKNVVDNRRFENKPASPNIPSIDGDVNAISAEQRKVFIGRQRNGFGKAMGDIAMPEGQTVETKTFDLIKESLSRRGYSVVTQGDSKDVIEVSIDEFWAWFTPGFATISFESNIVCKLTVQRGDKTQTIVVTGHGLNLGQIASDANWALAYTHAFNDFLAKLDKELGKAGF